MKKITKRQFITCIEEKMIERASALMISDSETDKQSLTAQDVYDIFMETLTCEILKGNNVSLACFGTFMLKTHKGHIAGFTKERIGEYVSLKFAPSNVFKRILNDPNEDYLKMVSENDDSDDIN